MGAITAERVDVNQSGVPYDGMMKVRGSPYHGSADGGRRGNDDDALIASRCADR